MKKTLNLIICMLLTMGALAGHPAGEPGRVLLEITYPEEVNVANNRLYVTQGVQVLIYSLDNKKLPASFGKEGMGPGEFRRSPIPVQSSLNLVVRKDHLMVNNIGKIAFFGLDGTYREEKKLYRPMTRYKPVGKGYVGFSFTLEDRLVYAVAELFDEKFNSVAKLQRFKHFMQAGRSVDPILGSISYFHRVYAWKDHVIIPGEDNRLHIYNAAGKKVRDFSLGVEPVKLTKELEKKYDTFYSTDARMKPLYLKSRHIVTFPQNLPLVRRIFFDGERMYVVTFNRRGGKSETVITDLEGKNSRKVFLPIREESINALYPLDIKNGKIYQLVENKSDKWELEITAIPGN